MPKNIVGLDNKPIVSNKPFIPEEGDIVLVKSLMGTFVGEYAGTSPEHGIGLLNAMIPSIQQVAETAGEISIGLQPIEHTVLIAVTSDKTKACSIYIPVGLCIMVPVSDDVRALHMTSHSTIMTLADA